MSDGSGNDGAVVGGPGPDDVHALAAAYALDAVDPDERATFEAHLATCADCRLEVAELTEAAVVLSEGLETEPPPALREQLLAQVAVTPQDEPGRAPQEEPARAPQAEPARAPQDEPAPVTSDELADRRARRSRGPGRWLLAGAAAAVIAVGAVAVTQWPQDSPAPSIVAVQEVLDAPDAVSATESVDGATVTVVTAYSLDRAVLQTEGLVDAPDDQDYQLWFVDAEGSARSAGLIPRDDEQMLLDGDPAGAAAVGITLEPAGGSEQPTSDPLVAVPLEG